MSRSQQERREFWRQLVTQQEQSGVAVRVLCQQHRVSEHSFYQWRKRLAERLPVKFALVETNGRVLSAAGVEVILTTGERLRIAPGADAATVRLALAVLREPR
jgi:transposase-like protein